MNPQAIFGLQFALSIIVWSVLAKTTFIPRLRALPRSEILFWLILSHMFRHIGMAFLVPGIVAEPLPANFAPAAAYGDLLAGILATASVIALRSNLRSAIAIIWVFNVIGAVNLVNALRNPEPIPMFGATWFIPTFIVPLLLVTHALIFRELIRNCSQELLNGKRSPLDMQKAMEYTLP